MARSVAGLIQNNSLTRKLVSKAWSLAKLRELVDQSLPLEIRALGHVEPGDLVRGELILLVTNPALASRLRFASKDVLKAIRQEGRLKVERIKVRVAPPHRQARTQKKRFNRTLNEDTRKHLLRAAAATPDTDLANAFRRLAQHK